MECMVDVAERRTTAYNSQLLLQVRFKRCVPLVLTAWSFWSFDTRIDRLGAHDQPFEVGARSQIEWSATGDQHERRRAPARTDHQLMQHLAAFRVPLGFGDAVLQRYTL